MKYSIEEIDEMRTLLHQAIFPWGSGANNAQDMTESRLRTLMMNGTSVEEVREYHKKQCAKYGVV